MRIMYSIGTGNFYHLNVTECLRKAKQLGYDGVEAGYIDLFSFKRGPDQRYISEAEMREDRVTAAILAAQKEYGTRLTGFHGPIVPLNAPDWDKRFWIYREAFRRMEILGAMNFTVHAGGGTVKNIDAELPVIEKSLGELAELGRKHGVAVSIESGCMPYEVRTIPVLAELIKRNPWLMHTADLSHNYFGRESDEDPYCIDKVLELLGDRIRVVHVVDHDPKSPFCHDLPAGMGRIDWKRFLKGLMARGFNGVFCCENAPDAVTTFLRKLKRITRGNKAVLPPSTVGVYCDPQSKHIREDDPAKVLGHDPFMKRLPFAGAIIRWESREEAWDGTTLADQLCVASLEYLKSALAEIEKK